MKTSFHINHSSPKIGSYMRNSGNGQRIMVVTHVEYGDGDNIPDIVHMKSYGLTNKGDFKPATKPRTIRGNVASDARGSVIVTSKAGYGFAHYYHVDKKVNMTVRGPNWERS